MYYVVPGMKLIPQKLKKGCWYACTQMLINWRRERTQSSPIGLIPPDLDARCTEIRDENKGMNNGKIIAMAQRLGLKVIPPMTATPEQMFQWLRQYGPLWVNGHYHIVVISGMRYIPYLGWQLQVHDPAPKDIGKVEWRSLNDWFESGTSSSSRDTSNWVQLSFLHCPGF